MIGRRSMNTKKGFTVIEVMLFLAITGLMLLGVLGGTYASINRQRYNDAVKTYADFLKGVYAEVISPQSNGNGNSATQAIFGKVIFFDVNKAGNANQIYTATLVGDANVPTDTSNFLQEMQAVMKTTNAGIYCGAGDTNSVRSYTTLWGSTVLNTTKGIFTGTVIIARSPVSGNVHTVYSTRNYGNPAENCSAVSNAIRDDLKNGSGFSNTTLDFCIDMFGVGIKQDVRVASDGRNSSAVQLVGDSDGSFACH